MKNKSIIIVGAGAAGIFAAINAAKKNPQIEVTVLEKSSKLLAKVKVSGGGRCNVTNACQETKELVKNYPRGNKELALSFSKFNTTDTVNWFSQRGVELKAEADGRMFPLTNSSQTIIDCLLKECKDLGVKIYTNSDVKSIVKKANSFDLSLASGQILECNKLLIATGGSNKAESYKWLEVLGHSIEIPLPSLFTFNIKNNSLSQLAGISVKLATVKIAGTKLIQKGPVLITHWGLSGPAVLKLSAWGARILYEKKYIYTVLINWLLEQNEEQAREFLEEYKTANPLKKVSGTSPVNLPLRLWQYLVSKAEIDAETKWNNLSGKNFNRLINNLVCDAYEASGKTTYKEEFVTCGGIKLNEVDMQTMESRLCKGLFFAGEVINVDGVTGGFNFQAAWTTGWLASQAV
ncbi:MAG: NAD(P)/FAD-dependent oxidoreductase [Bacteroidetes bacterium]|nr:NAD(P)/FAD-dependent oxidoreductase [Bacteroidota bacterium]HET6243181.1 NAD(P)/FAD-dependent oxidoreductase [Bacteroidia bacterium]